MTHAPTPGQFAEQLAQLHAKSSDYNPFYDHVGEAKKKLCMQALIEVLGEKDSLSQLLVQYQKADKALFPTGTWDVDRVSSIHSIIDDMDFYFEAVKEAFYHELEVHT